MITNIVKDNSRSADNSIKKDNSGRNDDKIKSPIGLGIAVVFILLGIVLPWLTGGDPAQYRVMAILLAATTLWATGALDPTIVSIAIIVLMPLLKVLPYDEAVAQLGDTILWRLMGLFIFIAAIKKSGLARRIAFNILKLAKGNVRAFLFLVIINMYILTFIVPAIMGRTMLMLSMVVGLFSAFKLSAPSNIGKSIMIALAYLSLITGTSSMFGSSTSILAVSLFQQIGDYSFTYMNWLIANAPVSFTITVSIYFILTRLYPPEMESFPGGTMYIENELKEMGSLSLTEKKVLIIFIFLLSFWILNIASIPTELIAALLLMLPKIGFMSWKDASKEVNWGVMLLFGSGLTIADALQKTNVITEATQFVLSYSGNFSPLVLAIVIFALTVLIRLGMMNLMAVVATFMPLVLHLGQGVGINPIWVGMISLFAGNAVFLPTQSPSGIITYEYGFYSVKEMIWVGVWLTVISFVVTLLAAFLYWPLIGIPIHLN
ncbi:MAG: hypothetical protein VR72_13230 [Clostridiaceae bacterium BRH_c20a]|nr:MAG: hypothetical protein VR72_13230 [Clostridiaceae bacterium BRH_c20a]